MIKNGSINCTETNKWTRRFIFRWLFFLIITRVRTLQYGYCTVVQYCTVFPALVVKPNRVHQLFSRTRVRTRVLAYSRTRVLAYFFHPDPCSGMAKKHIFGRNEKTRRRVFPQSEHDREVHCSDQTAASQDIPPRRFPALGGKHDRRRARARAMWGPCYYVWVILKRTFLGV